MQILKLLFSLSANDAGQTNTNPGPKTVLESRAHAATQLNFKGKNFTQHSGRARP